ncbi:MAG: hypothetical protein ABIB79_00270 [archaeon]
MKNKRSKQRRNNWLYWIPRVLGILFILFISLFALDIFWEYSGWELFVGLFMHLIPSYFLLAFLLIAWRWEKVGGYLYLLLALVFTVFFDTYKEPISFLLITGPVLLIGVLFLLNYYRYRK